MKDKNTSETEKKEKKEQNKTKQKEKLQDNTHPLSPPPQSNIQSKKNPLAILEPRNTHMKHSCRM